MYHRLLLDWTGSCGRGELAHLIRHRTTHRVMTLVIFRVWTCLSLVLLPLSSRLTHAILPARLLRLPAPCSLLILIALRRWKRRQGTHDLSSMIL